MDTSETYVKMCACSHEIQSAKSYLGYLDGDFWYDLQKEIYVGFPTASATWLPRQDQIQEMVKKDSINIELNRFYVFCLEKSYIGHNLPIAIFNSFEQLWLAFYMHEKHGLLWSAKEEKWIKK